MVIGNGHCRLRDRLIKTPRQCRIDLIANIALGEAQDTAKDILGRVDEYFLSQFAGSEGKRGVSFTRRDQWCG